MASTSPIALPAGDYLFNATYNGDGNYYKAYGDCRAEPLCVHQVHASVETALYLSDSDEQSVVSSINYGQSVYDTVTVSGTGATPTGTVTFWYSLNGGSWIQLGDPVQLQNGMASSEPMTPIAGDYLFNATYNGGNYLVSYGDSGAEPLCVHQVTADVKTALYLVDRKMKLR